jgi:hypothetical protein
VPTRSVKQPIKSAPMSGAIARRLKGGPKMMAPGKKTAMPSGRSVPTPPGVGTPTKPGSPMPMRPRAIKKLGSQTIGATKSRRMPRSGGGRGVPTPIGGGRGQSKMNTVIARRLKRRGSLGSMKPR